MAYVPESYGISPSKPVASAGINQAIIAAAQYTTKIIAPEDRATQNKETDSHKHYNHTSIDLILDDHEDRLLELESLIEGSLGPTIPPQKKVYFAIKAPNQGDEIVEITED